MHENEHAIAGEYTEELCYARYDSFISRTRSIVKTQEPVMATLTIASFQNFFRYPQAIRV